MASPANPTSAAGVALLLLLLLTGAANGVNFTCTTLGATCQGAIGYTPLNDTTLAALVAKFNVSSLAVLLGANGLPVATPGSHNATAGQPVRIPFPCICRSQSTGQSNGVPTYVVQPNDNLDEIARKNFGQFVTYQEIAAANSIPDPSLIIPGQSLYIPLPCSCDAVNGSTVQHYGYQIVSGDSIPGIAEKFGVDESTLLTLNNIDNPKSIEAEQILDVPLPVCKSDISSSSPDHGLQLVNGTYATTAQGCVTCQCSAGNDFHLVCSASGSVNRCPNPMCNGTLPLGKSTASGCNVTSCAYTGYVNGTTVTVNTALVPGQGNCKSAGSVTRRTAPVWATASLGILAAIGGGIFVL